MSNQLFKHLGSPRNRRIARRVAIGSIVGYLLIAYGLLPLLWETYARRHPEFDADPRITTTGDEHPGDPLNVAVVATEQELGAVMQAAGWYAAAALGLRSDLAIASDSVLSRPDDTAPVSNLYLFGRKEDFAFEQPVGDNPRQRHHVRFWKLPRSSDDGRPIWIGAATYDRSVGLSHTTGQITHHIDGRVDVERDHLLQTLRLTNRLLQDYAIDAFHSQLTGRNGGGDQWQTDGRLGVAVVEPSP